MTKLPLLLFVLLVTCNASHGQTEDEDSLNIPFGRHHQHNDLEDGSLVMTDSGDLSSSLTNPDSEKASLSPTLPSSQGFSEAAVSDVIALSEEHEEVSNSTDSKASTNSNTSNKISCDPRKLEEGEVSTVLVSSSLKDLVSYNDCWTRMRHVLGNNHHKNEGKNPYRFHTRVVLYS
jgi:hypothetical protein